MNKLDTTQLNYDNYIWWRSRWVLEGSKLRNLVEYFFGVAFPQTTIRVYTMLIFFHEWNLFLSPFTLDKIWLWISGRISLYVCRKVSFRPALQGCKFCLLIHSFRFVSLPQQFFVHSQFRHLFVFRYVFIHKMETHFCAVFFSPSPLFPLSHTYIDWCCCWLGRRRWWRFETLKKKVTNSLNVEEGCKCKWKRGTWMKFCFHEWKFVGKHWIQWKTCSLSTSERMWNFEFNSNTKKFSIYISHESQHQRHCWCFAHLSLRKIGKCRVFLPEFRFVMCYAWRFSVLILNLIKNFQ